MKYTKLKEQLQKRINDIDFIFFAFSDEQFKEGMEKIGLSPIDTDKIYSLGNGGYIIKDKSKDFKNILDENYKRLKEFLKVESQLEDALIYELGNHEFCITYDYTDTLDALSLEREEVPNHVLISAKEKYLENCNY